MSEKFGTIIIDGKIVNLDTASDEELEKYTKILEKREKEIEKEIDNLLDEDID